MAADTRCAERTWCTRTIGNDVAKTRYFAATARERIDSLDRVDANETFVGSPPGPRLVFSRRRIACLNVAVRSVQ